MAVKPFRWTNLKKVSAEEIQLAEALFELIPDTSARDKLGLSIRKMLMKHLGEKSFYYLDAVSTESYASFLSSVPDGSVLAVVGMEPSAARMVAYIDNNLAFLLIERLLGGSTCGKGEPSVESRPLSETEQGVLQYLIMQVLAEIWRICGESSRLHFRFERFCSTVRDIEKLCPNRESIVSLVFKVGIGELSGFVKLVFTRAFVEKAKEMGSVKQAFETGYFVGRLGHYDYIRTTLWAEGGRSTISADDLVALEAGDVVLFDESGLTLKDSAPVGNVDLRVGKGEEGALRAEIKPEGKIIKCTIIGG